MSEKLVNAIIGTFGGLTTIAFGKQILVFIISLLPILELRGGLLAAALLGLDPVQSYIICIIGNLLPIPFILLLINKILDWMRNSKHFKGIANWLDKKVEKHKKIIPHTEPMGNYNHEQNLKLKSKILPHTEPAENYNNMQDFKD